MGFGCGRAVLSIILFLSWILVSCASLRTTPSATKHCEVFRFSLDVGSGATKASLAKVDRCQEKILAVLFDESRAVPYASDLKNQPSLNLSESIQETGKVAIAELLASAKQSTSEDFESVAVMTGAFRQARNANSFRRALERKFRFSFKILSAEEEAKLGFLSAANAVRIPKEDLVVWDIGGSSLQISTYEPTSYLYVSSDFASVSMRNAIIEKIQKASLKEIQSPNPILKKQLEPSILWAKKESMQIAKALENWPRWNEKKVVGIGSVWRFSIQNQVGKKHEITLPLVERTLERRLGLTDDQIGGDYASTEVSNLILVNALMSLLRIENLTVAAVDLREGVLLNESWWSKK